MMIKLTSRMGTNMSELREWLDSSDSLNLSSGGRYFLEDILEDGPRTIYRADNPIDGLSDDDMGILTGNFVKLHVD